MSRSRRVAVLGAGIMGSAIALFLARRGIRVVLFDGASQPMSAASRWNEGKIHLGYLYNRDRSMLTASKMLPGGLMFKPLIEDLIGVDLGQATTDSDDVFLCHRQSVVPPDAMAEYFLRLDQLVRQHPDAHRYLVDNSACGSRRLSVRALNALTDSPDIVAGFHIQERSVATTWVADRICEALIAELRIEPHMDSRVTAVRPEQTGVADGPWMIEQGDLDHGPFDLVINALWNGRLEIDATAGLPTAGPISNRYRLALFVRTSELVDVPSAIITTGPFGDIKNYNGRDFYLSWYPKGLMVDSAQVIPPSPPALNPAQRDVICNDVLDALGSLLPGVSRVRDRMESMVLQGGWVFASAEGVLSDPDSSLHRRTDFGLRRKGTYLSVDTGKYSTAPWMARKIADSLF